MKLRSALLAATVLAAAPIAAKAQAISGLYIGAGAGANFMQNETLKSGRPSRRSRSMPAAGTGVQRPAERRVSTPASSAWSASATASATVCASKSKAATAEQDQARRKQRPGDRGAGGDEQKYGAMFNVLYDFDPSRARPRLPARRSPMSASAPAISGHSTERRIYGTRLTARQPGGRITTVPHQRRRRRLRLPGHRRRRRSRSPPSRACRSRPNTASWAWPATAPTTTSSRNRPAAGRSTPARTSSSATTTTTASCSASVTRSTPHRRRRLSCRRRRRSPRGGAHLPGVLRLGPCGPDRPRPADHRRGGPGHHPRAGHPDRGQRLHRQVGHAALQPGPVGPSGAERRQRAGPSRRAASGDPHQGFGETHPLVPTADGVREPQNRRVEIILR